MNQLQLNVKRRNTGKQIAKRIRKDGLVPGIFYTKGSEPIPVSAEPLALRPLIYTKETKIFDIIIEGEKTPKQCIVRDFTLDPVTDKITHIDFMGIDTSHKMNFEVPIVLKGQSVGVKEGGLLQHLLHKVEINCLPIHLPKSIEVDITNLKIGQSITLKNIISEYYTFLIPLDTQIVSCTHSRLVAKGTTENS